MNRRTALLFATLILTACGDAGDDAPKSVAADRGRNPATLELRKPSGVRPLAAVTPIRAVDLDRYLGDWYEIASVPAWFQAFCKSGVKANYTRRDDGNIRVTNSCYDANKSYRELVGVAAPRAVTETSRLLVSFVGDSPEDFGADYWVLYLSEDYDLVLVGEPQRDYGWILSRTPGTTQARLDVVAEQIERQGYTVDQFVLTDQAVNLE